VVEYFSLFLADALAILEFLYLDQCRSLGFQDIQGVFEQRVDRGRPTCGKAQHPDSLALQRTRFKRGEIISLMCVGITGCDIGSVRPGDCGKHPRGSSDILSHRASGVLAVADWHNVCAADETYGRLPIDAETMPAATAAPEPEEEPQGLQSRANGLRVWPPTALQPEMEALERIFAHSERLVFPTITAPAALSRWTRVASRPAPAVVAIAHTLLNLIYQALNTGQPIRTSGCQLSTNTRGSG